MEEKLFTVFARLDPDMGAEFKATLEREKRSMQAVVELALTDYIARSKTAALKAAAAQAEKAAA